MINNGDKVQVNQILWSNGVWEGVHKEWMSGYEFVEYDGDNAMVRIMTGFSAGCVVRYNKADVRKEK